MSATKDTRASITKETGAAMDIESQVSDEKTVKELRKADQNKNEFMVQGEKHPDGKPSRPLRILCIEDSMDFADVFCFMLEHFGHKIVVACNGIDGIASAKEFCPDIIFCDIGLPDMNGYEVAKSIRRDNILTSVFMVALTGYADPKDIQRAMNSGFNKHIQKPIDMTALRQILAEASLGIYGR